MHAQWTALTYSVTFYDTNSGSGGGGDGGSAPSVQSGSGVGSLTLSANTLSLSGYAFSGWATSNGSTTVAYADQGSVSITSNTTLNLYPVWTANTYTVTYDGNSNTSGSVPSVGSATYGSSFTVSANSGSLVRSGYSFSGWNTVANGSGTSFAAGSSSTWSIASNTTLYAVWGALPGAPTIGTPTAGSSQVTVTWTAPASNGGSAITDYVVEYSSDAGSTWTTFSDAVSTTTSSIVTGLTNGIAYKFRVSAKNA
ncbi:MAG: hypothetical protein EBZ46_08470, partial [Actinobacteria bacterium]|nr:hypothetical protein [Actinomycetota bacterium]